MESAPSRWIFTKCSPTLLYKAVIFSKRVLKTDEEDEALSETAKVRIELRYLLQDHFNIVQLYKMTENIFGGPVIMYYILQVDLKFQFSPNYY